ncbi:hypothetical protein KHQ81_14035 [Mycoplasmatota bacterium]|nr:hypothetical protein KHQ81_14035 [Mycoplasmatota bacterium]
MKKVASIYAIFMGISMIGMWIVFYLSSSIPEINTKPVELGMHVLAEILTAIVLILAGIMMWLRKKRAKTIYFLASGMLLYTLIMSPGYFLQKKEIGFTIMFASFLIILIIIIISLIKECDENGN